MKKRDESNLEKVPKCRICNHPDREGIETVGILSAASWRIAAKRINNTFGTNFTPETVEKHMLHHQLHKTAIEAGEVLEAAKDPETQVISGRNMLRQLIVQAALDIAKGHIKVKNISELIQVINAYENIKRNQEMEVMMEEGDASAFYSMMAAYGEAIKDTVSPEQLALIVMKANAAGAKINIGNIAETHPLDPSIKATLDQAVRDEQLYGRTRTRQELIEAEVIKVDGVVLPE